MDERNPEVDERDFEVDEKDDTHIKVDALLAVSVTPRAVLLPWRTNIVIAFTKRKGGRTWSFTIFNLVGGLHQFVIRQRAPKAISADAVIRGAPFIAISSCLE